MKIPDRIPRFVVRPSVLWPLNSAATLALACSVFLAALGARDDAVLACVGITAALWLGALVVFLVVAFWRGDLWALRAEIVVTSALTLHRDE